MVPSFVIDMALLILILIIFLFVFEFLGHLSARLLGGFGPSAQVSSHALKKK